MKYGTEFFIDSKGIKAVCWDKNISCHWKDDFYLVVGARTIHLVDCSPLHKFWTKNEDDPFSKAMWRHSHTWINPKEEIETAESFSYTKDIVSSVYNIALVNNTFNEDSVTVYAPPEYVESILDFIRPKL